jgi:ribonuclease G
MTRQNVTEGVREIMTRPCPTCDGDGVVLSEETIAIEFERRLRELASRAPRKTEAFLVQMNPKVSAQFTGNSARVLHQLEHDTGRNFHFEGSEGLPLDHFDILMEGTLEEVRERAIPFHEGDEVLVSIVEPHMYAVDDAVAKIDGYIVSVRGGGQHVGEKRLVRIEEAGRTSATAVLVDNGAGPVAQPKAAAQPKAKPAPRPRTRPAKAAAPKAADPVAEPEEPEAEPNGEGDDDALESKPRRRGRRGGRRRSAATAEATSAE